MLNLYKSTALGIAALAMSLSASAQLSGSYTICNAGCDYATIQDACDDLNTMGISGPVMMNLTGTVYNETVFLGPVPGTSASDTVVFNGNAPSNTQVIASAVNTGGALRAVWTIRRASHIYLENIRITNIATTNSTTSLLIQNDTMCYFKNLLVESPSPQTGTFSGASACRVIRGMDNHLMNSKFEGGASVTVLVSGSHNTFIKNCRINAKGGSLRTTVVGLGTDSTRNTHIMESFIKSGRRTAVQSTDDSSYFFLYNDCNNPSGLYAWNGVVRNGGNDFHFGNNFFRSNSGMANRNFRIQDSTTTGAKIYFIHNTVYVNENTSGTSNGVGFEILEGVSEATRVNGYEVFNNLFYSERTGRIANYPQYAAFDYFGYNQYQNAGTGGELRVGNTNINSNNSSWAVHQDSLDMYFGTEDFAGTVTFVEDNGRPELASAPAQSDTMPLMFDYFFNERDNTPSVGAEEFENMAMTTPVSVSASGNLAITVLGNPAVDAFRFISTEDAVATLWTLTGAQVGSINAQAGYVNTLGSSLPAGQYILRVATQTEVKNLSLIKQ